MRNKAIITFIISYANELFYRENACLDDNKRVNSLKPRIKRIITNIPVEIHEKCSRRAREYKLSYTALLPDDNTSKVDLKLKDTEKMKKEIKNKRCVMDQDYSLVKRMAEVIEIVDDNDCKKTSNIAKFEFKHKKFEK